MRSVLSTAHGSQRANMYTSNEYGYMQKTYDAFIKE